MRACKRVWSIFVVIVYDQHVYHDQQGYFPFNVEARNNVRPIYLRKCSWEERKQHTSVFESPPPPSPITHAKVNIQEEIYLWYFSTSL